MKSKSRGRQLDLHVLAVLHSPADLLSGSQGEGDSDLLAAGVGTVGSYGDLGLADVHHMVYDLFSPVFSEHSEFGNKTDIAARVLVLHDAHEVGSKVST